MDDRRFDALTRLSAGVLSRRGVGAGFLGVVTGLLGMAESAAAPCPKGKKRCKTKCIPSRQCCANAECGRKLAGSVCRRGRCQCAATHKMCQGRCVPGGACCGGCAAGQTCVAGQCRATCQVLADCPPPTQSCAQTTCAAGLCGVVPRLAGDPCRASQGVCDVAETCNGSSLACPADGLAPPTQLCAPGNCLGNEAQKASFCSGAGPQCPPANLEFCGQFRCAQVGDEAYCPTRCVVSGQCVEVAYCTMALECEAKRGAGEECTVHEQCLSGTCVSDVCA